MRRSVHLLTPKYISVSTRVIRGESEPLRAPLLLLEGAGELSTLAKGEEAFFTFISLLIEK
jgi:hypothetical protein